MSKNLTKNYYYFKQKAKKLNFNPDKDFYYEDLFVMTKNTKESLTKILDFNKNYIAELSLFSDINVIVKNINKVLTVIISYKNIMIYWDINDYVRKNIIVKHGNSIKSIPLNLGFLPVNKIYFESDYHSHFIKNNDTSDLISMEYESSLYKEECSDYILNKIKFQIPIYFFIEKIKNNDFENNLISNLEFALLYFFEFHVLKGGNINEI